MPPRSPLPKHAAQPASAELEALAQQLLLQAQRVAEAEAKPHPDPAERPTGARHIQQWERRLTERAEVITELRAEIGRERLAHERQVAAYAAEVIHLLEQLEELKARVKNLEPGAASRARHHRRFAGYGSFNEARSAQFAESTQGHHMDGPMFPRTNFQPTFTPHPSGEYQLLEFLALHDRTFVRAAYLAILRREPDPTGEAHYLAEVRAGENKAKLLEQFMRSEEANRHKTVIHGLERHLRLTRLCERPVIGRFVEAVLFLANVRGHLRDLRVLENHMIRIAEETQALNERNLRQLRALSK